MAEPLRVGDIVHGYGRDLWECCRIEAIGADWVVMRTLTYQPFPVADAGKTIVEDCARARDRFTDMHSDRCPAREENGC